MSQHAPNDATRADLLPRQLATFPGSSRAGHMRVNLLGYNLTSLSLRGQTFAPSSLEKTEAFLAEQGESFPVWGHHPK